MHVLKSDFEFRSSPFSIHQFCCHVEFHSICLAAVPSVKSSLSHSFEHNRLDNNSVPTSGYAVSSRVEVAGPGGDVTHVRGQATLRGVIPLTPWLVSSEDFFYVMRCLVRFQCELK